MKIPKNIYSDKQLEALAKHDLNLDFSKDYLNDDIADVEEVLADIMMDEGFTDGEPNENCAFWEKIFDTWQDVMDTV